MNSQGLVQLPSDFDVQLLNEVWVPLSDKRLLELFAEMGRYPQIEAFFHSRSDITQDERAILIFLNSLHRESKSTRGTYTYYICAFLNFCARPFQSVKVWNVNDYVNSLVERGLRDSTVATAMGGVRSFYSTMHLAGFIQTNPTQLVKIPKRHKTAVIAGILAKALSYDDVDHTVEFLKQECLDRQVLGKKTKIRNLCLFYIMARMGLRVTEVCDLSWGDMQLVQNQWGLAVHGKGRKLRFVAMPDNGLELLRIFLQSEFDVQSERVIPYGLRSLPIFSRLSNKSKRMGRHGIYHCIKKIGSKALDRHLHPHALRHTCFTHLHHLFKVPLVDIQKVAGHAKIDTTSNYVGVGEAIAGASLAFNKRP